MSVKQGSDELIDISVLQIQEKDEDISKLIRLEHLDWSLDISLDPDVNSLMFQAIVQPNKWLAIGYSNALLETKIIEWAVPAQNAPSLYSVYKG